MPRLVHIDSGTTVNLEGEDYKRAVASGRYAPAGDEPGVEVTLGGSQAFLPEEATELRPDYAAYGSVGSVSPEQRSAGEEAAHRENIWGTPGQEALTLGEGALDALTLGGYGAANEALGGEFEERADVNPGYHGVGEFAGIAGAVLVPGGGLVAAGRGGRAGAALAKTPAGLVSSKATALAEHLGGLRGAAVGQALEGAAYATGQTLSQAYIKDEPLTASSLYAEVGRNAMFGAGIGASGAALAGALTRGGSKLASAGEGTVGSVLDLSTKEGQRVTKTLSNTLNDIDNVTENSLAALEGKLPKRPIRTKAEEAALPKGPLSVDDLEHTVGDIPGAVPPRAVEDLTNEVTDYVEPRSAEELQEALDGGYDVTEAPAHRRKILADIGDQVHDENTLFNKLSAPEVRKLRKSYADMDEAVVFAREAGTPAAARKANRALDKYEEEVTGLAKKLGLDVEEQLEISRRSVVPATKEAQDAASKARVEMARAEKAGQEAVAQPYAEPPTFNPPMKDFPPPVPPARAPAPKLSDIPASKVMAENLRVQRSLAAEALGVEPGRLITAESVRSLLTKAPDDALVGLNRIDDAIDASRKLAEELGDTRMLNRLDRAAENFAEQVNEITGGVKLTDLDRSVIATSMGSEALASSTFKTKVAEKMHELLVVSKAGGGKLPAGVTRKSMMGGLFTSAAARGAARVGSKAGTDALGGGLLGAAGGGIGAAAGFHVIRALAGQTSHVVGRIAGAAGKAMKRGAKLVRPATLTAAWLIRESRWDMNPEAAKSKSTPKTLQEAFKQRAEELAKIQANPDAAQLAIHNELAPLRKHAPFVADELEMIALSVPLYLADKMPKDPGVARRWGKSYWQPSDVEITRWGEHMRGAVAPVETFEEMMESGYISPQAAEAVRTLHPDLFNQMRTEVFQRSEELRDKLDHGGQVRISLFFDVPVTSTMRPEFRAFMKERHALRAQTQAPTGQRNLGTSSGGADAAEPFTGAQQLLKQ